MNVREGKLLDVTGTVRYEVIGKRTVPREAETLHQQAREAGGHGDYEKAIALLEQASELAPDWPYPVYDRAYTHMLMNDCDAARRYYQKTLELSPLKKVRDNHGLHFPRLAINLLLVGFFAAEVDGHQNFDGNATAAMAEIVDADNFAERLAVERTGPIGIGISDKHAHTFRVGLVLRSKIDAVTRSVQCRQDFVEIISVRIGRPYTNSLSKPQPRFAATLRTR